MKTKTGWENSALDLDEYLNEPCEIDEALSNYIGECVSPKYIDEGLTQGGDPIKHDGNPENGDLIGYYATTSTVNGKHFYLGVLPEFRQ